MKSFLRVLFAMLCISSIFVFTACDKHEGNDTPPTGAQVYVMEAEYLDLDGITGGGISSSMEGPDLIFGNGTQEEKDKGWSNGYYVGFTYTIGFRLDFVFNSDAAASAIISVRLGSELGEILLTPDAFSVKLNDVEIHYNPKIIPGSDMQNMEFVDMTVSTSAQLVEGENIISLIVNANTFNSGQVGGPMIDCIKVTTTAQLTWVEKTDNPDRRGAI